MLLTPAIRNDPGIDDGSIRGDLRERCLIPRPSISVIEVIIVAIAFDDWITAVPGA